MFSGSNGNTDSDANATLTIVGDDVLALDTGDEARLRIRYLDTNGFPLINRNIEFDFDGNGFGAALQTRFVQTDSSGLADVQLRVGDTNSRFRIRAIADQRLAVTWTIDVIDGASVQPRGTFEINSVFNGTEDTPGALGGIMQWAVDITDDPGDPGRWLLEQLDSSVSSSAATVISPIVNTALETRFPRTFEKLEEFGEKVQEMTEHFGLRTTMRVYSGTRTDGGVIETRADHEVDAFVIKYDGKEKVYEADEFYTVPLKVRNIDFEYDTRSQRIEIEEHDLPIPYGTVLARALENLVIPSISEEAETLEELFNEYIDCDTVGEVLADEIPPHSRFFYRNLCDNLLEQTAEEILQSMAEVDQRSEMILEIRGTANGEDTDDDSALDEIFDGRWRGGIRYDGQTENFPYSGREFWAERK